MGGMSGMLSMANSPRWTIPANWYADAAIYRLEQDRIFAREWMLIGFAAQMPKPGDTLARDIAGRPVFVIRTRDGGLRAFLNICRHRAARLVPEGAGHCDLLRCPYHGWLYDAEGRLKATPEFGDAAELDRGKLGLVSVKAAEWRGLVFVNLDPVHATSKRASAILCTKPSGSRWSASSGTIAPFIRSTSTGRTMSTITWRDITSLICTQA
jgi:phenylpropionate dioxygenase-like ring-hydroxylating dioxygenase large terminal subunit